MPRRRKRMTVTEGALDVVRRARDAARRALDSLRKEIRSTETRLQKLLAEERSFREEIFGAVRGQFGRPAAGGGARKAGRTSTRRRKGPPKADRYFSRLPNRFTLEQVRKLAGRKAGISLAQWSRAKRIRKVGDGYQKLK